jgi:hypothetical protein
MVLIASLIAVGLLVLGTLYFLAVVRGVLKGLVKELRDEREIVGIQKTIIGLTAEQITIQRKMIDTRYEMVANGLTVMRLMVERQSDPAWMKKFDAGRENAKNN